MKKYEDLLVGDRAEIRRRISPDDVRRFVELTGDDNPLHTNRQFAAGTSFKDVVVHGMLGASFISTIIGKHLPGDGALWISQNFQFLLPVRVGDELLIAAEVVKKHPAQRLLQLKVDIHNQHGQTVLQGEGMVRMLELATGSVMPASSVPEHKTAIITGGSRGIGAATALLLARQGWKVVVNYRSDQVGAEAVCASIRQHEGSAIAVKADVTDAAAVGNMVAVAHAAFGPVHGLVHNATGRIIPRDFGSVAWDNIQEHLNVQVQGAFHCLQALLDDFITAKKGAVVHVGSLYSDQPMPKLAGYCAAKGALAVLTKALAVEFGPKGLRFNTVAPGMTDTVMIADVPEKIRLVTAMQTPLRRLAAPEDVAAAIAFLLSDDAAFISGETLRVCGGQFML